MTLYRIRRRVRLHERAERQANEYKRLSGNRSAQSKSFWHMRKAEQLYSQVLRLIRDFTLDYA